MPFVCAVCIFGMGEKKADGGKSSAEKFKCVSPSSEYIGDDVKVINHWEKLRQKRK